VPEHQIEELALRRGPLFNHLNEELDFILCGDGVEGSNGDGWRRRP
jgi:hypothetical protein